MKKKRLSAEARRARELPSLLFPLPVRVEVQAGQQRASGVSTLLLVSFLSLSIPRAKGTSSLLLI